MIWGFKSRSFGEVLQFPKLTSPVGLCGGGYCRRADSFNRQFLEHIRAWILPKVAVWYCYWAPLLPYAFLRSNLQDSWEIVDRNAAINLTKGQETLYYLLMSRSTKFNNPSDLQGFIKIPLEMHAKLIKLMLNNIKYSIFWKIVKTKNKLSTFSKMAYEVEAWQAPSW